MLRLLLGLTLGFSAGLYAPTAATSWADGGDIMVLEVGTESRYPNGVRFFVTATSPQVVDEIRIFIKKTGRLSTSVYWTLDIEPDEVVSAETVLRTGGGADYVPPGAEIRYSFEVWDRAGAVHRTPNQRFIYSDTRFDWRTVSSELITVYYHGEGQLDRAAAVLEAAQEAIQRIGPVLGIDPAEPFRIVSYNGYDEMAAALPFNFRVLRGRVHTQGMAFGDERVVLIQGSDPAVRGIVSHEVTHLATAEVTGRAHERMPAWLKEGLAEYGNLAPTREYERALTRGILDGEIRPLRDLSTFGGAPQGIMISYGQSQSVVKYLISQYGEAKIAELMPAVRGTLNIDQALERVYGLDLYGLDTEWRKAMGLEPLPPPEEAEPRPQERQTPTPQPPPSPTPTPTAPAPTATPSVTPATPTPAALPTATTLPFTPTPRPTPTRTASEEGGQPGKASPGCSTPAAGGGASGDLAFLAVLVGPLAMLALRGSRSPSRRQR